MIYAIFEIVTHFQIGVMAIVVGWLVATAMRKGAQGCGGKRYQITAALLIYAAVSLSAIPVAIARPDRRESAQTDTVAHPHPPSFGAAISVLTAIGLASPFLGLTENPASGLIGLFIIFIGIRYAWRILRGSDPNLVGPFPNTASA